jgi:putative molybdopterin biosynthesis protein
MGGITAVKAGHAHTGGVHLLDTQTGEYNLSYVKKYFPKGGVVLIEGVTRTQGIMTAAGNPKRIKTFVDIASLSYVNRQRGSGTRILCDYLAQKAGLETDKIYGYGREEYTHTGVAALIAAGSADAGLGIYSAAKLYNLDFIPVAEEYYDFICLEENLEDEKMQAFLAVLKSDLFRQRLESLGGYGLKNPGSIKAVF